MHLMLIHLNLQFLINIPSKKLIQIKILYIYIKLKNVNKIFFILFMTILFKIKNIFVLNYT